MREIRNATITRTQLGREDHGILTCWITLDYGGSGQDFGGYSLDEPVKDGEGKFLGRRGTAYGMRFIENVLNVLGVDAWEKLKGVSCRVDCEQSQVHRIGHYLRDDWFDPAVLLTKVKDTK